jgi:hypothetical protein
LCATADASADNASVGDVFALLFTTKRQGDLNNGRFGHRLVELATSDVIFNSMIQRFEGGPSGTIRLHLSLRRDARGTKRKFPILLSAGFKKGEEGIAMKQ